jgi:hypothetical protein
VDRMERFQWWCKLTPDLNGICCSMLTGISRIHMRRLQMPAWPYLTPTLRPHVLC